MKLIQSGHVAHTPRPVSFEEAAELTPPSPEDWVLLRAAMRATVRPNHLPSPPAYLTPIPALGDIVWVVLKDPKMEPLLGHLHLVGCSLVAEAELHILYRGDPACWKSIHLFSKDLLSLTPTQLWLLRWPGSRALPNRLRAHPLYRALRLELPEHWVAYDQSR